MKPIFKFSLALLALAPLVALAQPAKTPAASAPKGADTGGAPFTIKNASDGTTTYDTERGIGHMTKNIVVTQTGEDVVIFAQDATFDRNRNVANATVQLKVVTRDSTITGAKLFADFDERTATITESVKITSHGKKDGVAPGLRGEATKKPITVLCERVDWDYDIRQGTATGNIRIFQDANRGTCNKIIYDEKRNIINLLGNVRFVVDKKGTFIGQNILVYLQEGRISGTGIKFVPLAGEGLQNSTPSKTRTPKQGTPFGPAPTLPPDLVGTVVAPPPAPTAMPTATEEPEPAPPSDVPETPDAPAIP